MEAMDYMGFAGTYHVCHIPNANKKSPRPTNLGYAFICFANAAYAAAFCSSFHSFCFPGNA
eukprot:CAMPEP_0170623172 /NCGR_PEP_ID=MMETSP0224-20130122/29547_1 /TAXON_ID=285029 /ORGANISM="Togula jolla, Strain CCCM 725" /LENGTH=60 /DNA_ID=CAMNT_0010949589 /DNA_START=21 /DNA_END=200 /DNA_ORIENTATION=+